MGDLLNSLILSKHGLANHNNSQDSFHSVQEVLAEANLVSPQTVQNKLQEQLEPSNAHKAADTELQNSHQGYDINTYLSDPSNAALLNPKPISTPFSKRQTGYYVSLLYQNCQLKGLTPEFEIEGVTDKAIFTGVLKVGDVTITLDEACRSKKEARERLAEKAIEPVKAINIRNSIVSTPLVEDDEDKSKNWIGMLQGM